MNYMRILGVDPGIGRLGWGIIDKEKGNVTAVAFDCFETAKTTELPKRLEQIYREMKRILATYSPEIMAVEDLFFNKNVKTAFIVGQARGVVLLTAAEYNISVAVYTPLVVKNTLVGYGRAEKRQVGKMVQATLHLTKIPSPDDTSDALAIAITHAYSHNLSSL
ncbi:MAG TPA: crossover junction endodeoxyribonuclease RuvC [Patescibacteria group bacterium]|nr:crossover junction endodeoxyribonuclease RuvC [Patescibacteria group bacterium]